MERPDCELFTDGSFGQDRKQLSGYEVTTHHELIKLGTCPSDVLAQKADLIAPTQASELSKGKQGNKILF